MPGPGIATAERLKCSAWSHRASRLWYVLRYYRSGQLAMRLLSIGKRRITRLTGNGAAGYLPKAVPQLRANLGFGQILDHRLAARRANGAVAKADRVRQGRFEFLNQERLLPDPVDWQLRCWPEVPHLWRFCLQYHEFLLDMAAAGLQHREPGWFDRAWDLVGQWIEHNPPRDASRLGDAWHPYCISRRLPAWLLLWTASAPPDELAEPVLRSVACQASFLEHHLEWDVRGNHLVENAKALVMAGTFLDSPDADCWLRKGASILRRELAEQILPHGEHFERSPMYHAQMLEAVLDVGDVVRAVMPDLSELCSSTALRMAAFLKTILHPDGEIPLLGDSCLGETTPPGHLIARAGEAGEKDDLAPDHHSCSIRQPTAAQAIGAYWAYRHDEDFLLFDAGPVGPDHLPAHAHADLLTFEASIQGRRVIVDSGVFDYQAGTMREYCRSTAAHNVLQIEDQDQCDMWSSFRMGYRGWPGRLETGLDHGFHWARASHNAYRRLGVPRVGRWMACRRGGPWFCIDWAEGTERHELTNRLHLHPDVAVELVKNNEVHLNAAGLLLRLYYLLPGEISVAKGWYCPEFGRRVGNSVIQWTSVTELPSVCGWYLAWGQCNGVATLDDVASAALSVRWVEGETQRHLRPIENASAGHNEAT